MGIPAPTDDSAPCLQRTVIDRKETQAVSKEPCVFDQQGRCTTHDSPRLLPESNLCVNAKHRSEQLQRTDDDYIIDPKLEDKINDMWEM